MSWTPQKDLKKTVLSIIKSIVWLKLYNYLYFINNLPLFVYLTKIIIQKYV
jgi:hypothetical protein